MSHDVPEAFIFMKVDNHAGENFQAILERKTRERERAGRIFWGYGGSACHPITQVQPFARRYVREQGRIILLMEPVDSRADPDVEPAREYSEDGATWLSLPDGITVIGSRYAMVLDELNPSAFEINLAKYQVGIGFSRGKNAAEYIQGRVDKGCLIPAPECPSSVIPPLKHSIKFSAKLLDPYAVLLR